MQLQYRAERSSLVVKASLKLVSKYFTGIVDLRYYTKKSQFQNPFKEKQMLIIFLQVKKKTIFLL